MSAAAALMIAHPSPRAQGDSAPVVVEWRHARWCLVSGSGPGQSLARPRQVTVAGVMAAVACLLLVLSLFDSMAQIRSSDTDRMVRQFLSSAPGRSLGLDVEAVVQVMRAVVLLSGALAAAGVILSVYALRRHRGARVGLSVVAVLMLFSTTFVAGLLPLVVVLGAAMLWRREARDWFDGRAPRPRETSAQTSAFDQPRPPAPPQQPGPQQPGQLQPGPAQSPGGPGQHPGWPQAFGGAFGVPPAPYAGTTGWPQPMYGAL